MKEQGHLDDFLFPQKGCNQAKGSRISFYNELDEAGPKPHQEWNSNLTFWCLPTQWNMSVCGCIFLRFFTYIKKNSHASKNFSEQFHTTREMFFFIEIYSSILSSFYQKELSSQQRLREDLLFRTPWSSCASCPSCHA